MAAHIIDFLVVVVFPVLINKTTETRLHGLRPHLREIWFAVTWIYVAMMLVRPESEHYFMTLKQGFGSAYPVISYVLAGTFGLCLFVGYWWFLGIVLPPTASATEVQGPPPQPKKPDVQQSSQGEGSPNTAIIGDNNTINYRDPQVIAKLNEIKQLLKAKLGQDDTPEKWLKKYPLGYVIFDAEYQRSVLPLPSHNKMLEDFNFDWSVAGVTKLTASEFEFRMPDIRAKHGTGYFRDYRIGDAKRVGPLGGVLWEYQTKEKTVDLVGEIVALTDKGMIFALGFKEKL